MHWIFHLFLCSLMAVLKTHLIVDPAFIHLDGRYHCYHLLYVTISYMLPSYFVTLSLTKQHALKVYFLDNKRNSRSSPCSNSHHAGFMYTFFLEKSSRYLRKGNRSAESSNRPPSPPSSVRCVNTSFIVLTLVISLKMTPSPTHNMASAKDLVTPNSYIPFMT